MPAIGDTGSVALHGWHVPGTLHRMPTVPSKATTVPTSHVNELQTWEYIKSRNKGPELTCCCCCGCGLRHAQHLANKQLVAVDPWVGHL